jgi:hypothetical protein
MKTKQVPAGLYEQLVNDGLLGELKALPAGV